MKDDAIEKLAQLLFDKIMEKQDQADEKYHNQITNLINNGYVIDDVTERLGINEEEKLVVELAKMQTIMMILEDKEEYEKAAIILKKIKIINRKLNEGSGKY